MDQPNTVLPRLWQSLSVLMWWSNSHGCLNFLCSGVVWCYFGLVGGGRGRLVQSTFLWHCIECTLFHLSQTRQLYFMWHERVLVLLCVLFFMPFNLHLSSWASSINCLIFVGWCEQIYSQGQLGIGLISTVFRNLTKHLSIYPAVTLLVIINMETNNGCHTNFCWELNYLSHHLLFSITRYGGIATDLICIPCWSTVFVSLSGQSSPTLSTLQDKDQQG